MATGVKPRDEEPQITRTDLEAIQDAMKQKKFRDLLAEYCEEVRDPANQALYQKEMVQLEKERGYDVTFINPKGGYVIKTSVAGDRKAFINICSNENIQKPSCKIEEINGQRGMNWSIPYSLVPPREDYDSKRERCVIYDVVFHPDTLRMAGANKQFRELVNKTALDGLQKQYNIHLDSNNFRFPKSLYKGMSAPAVIRKEDPNFQPPTEEDNEDLPPEMVEKLFPQKIYGHDNKTPQDNTNQQPPRKSKKKSEEFTHKAEGSYTIPKYVIKQQKNIELQDFTYNKDSKQYSAIPSQIVVEVNLPLLSSTSDCTLDVEEKHLSLVSEKPAKYKLDIPLPYSVNDKCGNAKFDKSKRKLIVTLPVIKKNEHVENNSLKIDSGVESEGYSGSQSEEENEQSNLIVELSSSTNEAPQEHSKAPKPKEPNSFFNNNLGYTVPSYTHNILDDALAFTFHVKNTEPDSVQVQKEDNKIHVKFTSIGSGYVPVHYAAIIQFDDNVKFENVTGEAWDNNVILQLELAGETPQKFQIGFNDVTHTEYLNVSQVKATKKEEIKPAEETAPVVEVTNFGSETNIVVSSNLDEDDEIDEDDSMESPTSSEKEIVWTETHSENGAKSILRKPYMMRSFSESSADVASSMDYISSDCIPEESSFKKTVRFNDVISKQFYRYNSSIEGQKKKNQRKKSKKRNQEQRRSESEAEEDSTSNTQVVKPRLKSVLKQRRDSGLADTSDPEDCKNATDEKPYNTATKDIITDNNVDKTSDTKPTSILNIVDKKDESKSEPELWETSDPEDCKNAPDEKSYNTATKDIITDNNVDKTSDTKPTSILNIVDKKDESKSKPELRETSDPEDCKNAPDEKSYNTATEDIITDNNEDNTSDTKPTSILNIVDKKDESKSEPELWATNSEKTKENTEAITCENLQHKTDLYNPDKLNKGQYLEVCFKNDLIFDLDM